MSDKFIREMKKLQKNVKKIEKECRGNKLDIEKAFDAKFMSKYTSFKTLTEFLQSGNFSLDIESIPDEELDQYVKETTKFISWQSMLDTAVLEYIERNF